MTRHPRPAKPPLALLLIVLLGLWALASTLDYHDARTDECARRNLQWDRASDSCYNLTPGDQHGKKRSTR